jgi:small subunit ribosomal protein S3
VGQKISPIAFRIGINKDWNAKWFASKKDFKVFLERDVKIRKYLDTKLKDASVANLVIERNKRSTELTIYTAKPGVIIGHGGEEIETLKKDLSKLVDENVQISIVEIKSPDLHAQIVADSIAHQIENRASFRAVQKRAIRNTMKAGALGIKTKVSGRLNGADIARSEGYSEGTTPLHTIRADIDYAASVANTTFGKIGVKVWIYKGEILPTKKNKGGNENGVNTKEN